MNFSNLKNNVPSHALNKTKTEKHTALGTKVDNIAIKIIVGEIEYTKILNVYVLKEHMKTISQKIVPRVIF